MKKPSRVLRVEKVVGFAVAINVFQILAMIGVFLYVLFKKVTFLSRGAELTLLGFCLLIVIWGAAMDIRDALITRRVADQTRMLEEAYGQLEDLNATLRCQRHDFMNHLQVVFSLTEMQEYGEAMNYIERVYGDIQRVSSVLKTSIPAVNALLAAKHADCEENHIRFETEIASAWTDFPIPGWEMCRVMGNLIDNAVDALTDAGTKNPLIRVTLGETPRAYVFSVSNNGPAIPDEIRESIFHLGFTTKSAGHGSGLSIVSEILESYSGEITVESTPERTSFSGTIPKAARKEAAENLNP